MNGGNLEVTGSPGVLNIQGGVFDGNGTVNGNVSVSGSGQFNPGTSPGEISITNNHTYTQAAPGVLNIDVNGTAAGFDYDRILISGAATLGGELKVNLGYTPALGDSFTILEHASRTGTFSKLTFPSPGAGRGWDISYSATQTKLTIAELAGAFLVVDGHAGAGTSSDDNGVLEPGERVARRAQLAQHDRQLDRVGGNGLQHHRPGRRDLHAERHHRRLRHRQPELDHQLLQRDGRLLPGVGLRLPPPGRRSTGTRASRRR